MEKREQIKQILNCALKLEDWLPDEEHANKVLIIKQHFLTSNEIELMIDSIMEVLDE